MRAMEKPKTKGGVFNLGNPQELPIHLFATTVLDLLGRPRTGITHKPMPPDDPTRRRPDISRASKVLGWKPRVSLVQGLSLTIDYYRGRMGR
jgi:nucleoside-diphosphate-sugar epimerase